MNAPPIWAPAKYFLNAMGSDTLLVTCPYCGAVVMSGQQSKHEEWHAKLDAQGGEAA